MSCVIADVQKMFSFTRGLIAWASFYHFFFLYTFFSRNAFLHTARTSQCDLTYLIFASYSTFMLEPLAVIFNSTTLYHKTKDSHSLSCSAQSNKLFRFPFFATTPTLLFFLLLFHFFYPFSTCSIHSLLLLLS